MKKDILEILLLIQKEFERRVEINTFDYGLCAIAHSLYWKDLLTVEDEITFARYFSRTMRSRKWFYDCENFKTLERNQFAWKIGEITPRRVWLERNIKKLEEI